MLKIGSFFAVLCLWVSLLPAMEKLPAHYQVAYGDPHAPLQVVEYISLSCPKCLECFRKDFKDLKHKYIDSQKVHWVFHLNPADILTLQAMVCLEALSPKEKQIFWEVMIETMEDPAEGVSMMQAAMEAFSKPLPQLHRVSYLETTQAFTAAYRYLKQIDVVGEIPTVEINGKLYDAYPSRKFLEKQFLALLPERRSP